jgi:hypothetical protein
LPHPVFVDVLEEVFPWNVLAALNDPGQPAVAQRDLMSLAALAAELEPDTGAGHLHVAVAQGGEPGRAIGPGILVVADSDAGTVEQPDHSGKDLFSWQPWLAQIALYPAAQPWQRFAEGENPAELGFVSFLPDAG